MITRFGVKNFKALRDVELELTPLHVLIGPNDSGKTSILQALAAVWYVDKDNTSGTEDGTTWATAFTTFQPAIEAEMDYLAIVVLFSVLPFS